MLTFLLLLIGVALTAGVVSFFGISEVLSVLLVSDPLLVLLAIVLQVVSLFLLALRLKVMAHKYKPLSSFTAFRVTMVSFVADFLIPGVRVGGEPVKIMMLRKKFGGTKASAIVAVDTLSEIISSIIAMALILFVFLPVLPVIVVYALVIFLVVMISLLLFVYKVITTQSWLGRIMKWTLKAISRFKKIQKKNYTLLFRDAFKLLAKDRRRMGATLGLSFLLKIFEFARMWVVFLALGYFVPIETVIIVWAVIVVLFLIPWLPGSLGLIELGGAAAFVLLGVSSNVAAGGVLLDRFISFWFVLILGLVFAWASGLSMKELKIRW